MPLPLLPPDLPLCAVPTSATRVEELDSARFMKLCRDTGLLCRRFTAGCADVAFTTAKRRKDLRRWAGQVGVLGH